MTEIQLHCADINAVRKSDQEITYNTAQISAFVTVGYALLHLMVNPVEYPKPWILRNRIKAPLELIEFKEYIADVRNWLSTQSPTNYYGSLVYMQSLTFLLSTMEITNDAT